MRGVDATHRLIEVIRNAGDVAEVGEGVPPEDIASAEEQLGLHFPPSYRCFIEELGTCDVAGLEFLGVYRTPAMGDQLLGSVIETLEARDEHGLAESLIVFMFDGMGNLLVLDMDNVDARGEAPVLAWNPGVSDVGAMERLGDDFGEFALAACERAIAGWQG